MRAEITRNKALGKPGPDDLRHLEIYEGDTDQEIAFLGRHIATTYISDEDAYLTRGGQIVIYVAGLQRLWLFSQYSDLDPDAWPADLMEQIRVRDVRPVLVLHGRPRDDPLPVPQGPVRHRAGPSVLDRHVRRPEHPHE